MVRPLKNTPRSFTSQILRRDDGTSAYSQWIYPLQRDESIDTKAFLRNILFPHINHDYLDGIAVSMRREG